MTARTGIGIDVHPLVEGRPLILGGVTVPFARGLDGHSDGDVLIHAVIDAMLGGAGLGDIGTHFPSSDSKTKGIASSELLIRTVDTLAGSGWQTLYVDATIVAERPVLRPHMAQIKQSLAALLRLDADSVNVKATTSDGLGSIGRGEGIAALSIATVDRAE